MSSSRSLAVVTGASVGIGRAVARALAREQRWDLVLVARREKELGEVAREVEQHGVKAHVAAADLLHHTATEQLVAACAALGPVEVLVNNAGFGYAGPFVDAPDTQLKMVDLNVRALTALTLAFLPGMLGRRRGNVVNISSVAGFQPVPFMSVYAATKAYVTTFSAGLHEELRDSGVVVSAVCPGPVDTAFADIAGTKNPRGPVTQTADDVAEVVLDAMRRGKGVVTTGPLPALAAAAGKVSPTGAAAFVVGRAFKAMLKK